MPTGRFSVVFITFLLLLASVGPAVGPALAQENNSSTTTTTGSNATDTGTIGDQESVNSTNSSQNETNTSSGIGSTGGITGTGAAAGGESSQSSGEQSYGSGYLEDTVNNRSTNQNGSVDFGNNSSGTNNSSSGLSSDADGVKGIAINAALDTFARVLKFISNQIANGLSFVLQKVMGAVTWTSTPEMGDSMYQDPSNGIWPGLYSSYKTIWQPLALALAALLTAVYIGFGRYGLNWLPSNVQQSGFLNLGLAWIAASDISWVMTSMVLNLTDLINRFLIGSIELEIGFLGVGSLALLAMLLIYLLGFWVVVAMMLVYGFRIVAVIALTPLIPAIFAGRAIPVQGVSDIMDSLWRLWIYLVILPLPVGAVLAVGFGGDMMAVVEGAGIGGAFFAMIIQTGTLFAALVFPYILYQRSGAQAMAIGVAGSAPTEKIQEALGRQEEKVQETREQGKQKSGALPGRVQNMAVKAQRVGILGQRGTGGGVGGGGGGGGQSTRNEVYVKSETRRKKLES